MIAVIEAITGSEPLLWSRKGVNIQQCYSTMYSKLILAYLIAEIKEGNLLPLEFLNQIKDYTLEQFSVFRYDDMGYEIGKVLSLIVEESIKQNPYFSLTKESLDLFEVYEAEYHDLEEGEVLKQCILEQFPEIENDPDAHKSEYYETLGIYASQIYESDAEMLILRSPMIYEIREREKQIETELGKIILDDYDFFKAFFLQYSYVSSELDWTIKDDERREECYYAITTAEVIEDDYWGTIIEVRERLHIYQYNSIIQLENLRKNIKKYIDMYF